MDAKDATATLAATIEEHTSHFAVFWRDGHDGLVALSGRSWPDSAIVVRPHGGRTVFTDEQGNVAAIVGRGWSLVGSGAAPCSREPGTVGFAGTVCRSEVSHVVSALSLLSARRVHVAGNSAARAFTALLGSEGVERTRAPHGLARALLLAPGRVAAAFDFTGVRQHRPRVAEIEPALRNALRMGEWGVPPPANASSALRVYAEALVHDRPWEPPSVGTVRGTREDLLAAIDAATRWWETSLVVDPQGRSWKLRHAPLERLRRGLAIRGIAFPVPAPTWRDAEPDHRLYVSPSDDVALATSWDFAECDPDRAWIGRSALPLLYGALAHHLGGDSPCPPDTDALALAFGIATARIRSHGLTIGVEGLYVGMPGPYRLQPLLARNR